MRLDSLSSNLRPLLDNVRNCIKNNSCSEENFEKMRELVTGIKPLPPKSLVEELQNLKVTMHLQNRNEHLRNIERFLESLFKKEKAFAINYVGQFGQVESAMGISIVFSIFIYALPIMWIPTLLMYYMGIANGWVLSSTFILALVFEFIHRKGGRPSAY
jgi:hypothetical protein